MAFSYSTSRWSLLCWFLFHDMSVSLAESVQASAFTEFVRIRAEDRGSTPGADTLDTG